MSKHHNLIQTQPLLLAAAALGSLAVVPAAHAHISVDEGGTHMSRNSADGLKDAPCGVPDSARGTQVYTYKPGATITVSIVETIPHPGYFRIAFDQEGDDDFPIPTGTEGTMGACAGDPKCGAGKADYCSNETVLLDNLDPHAGGGFGMQKKYTWSVKLPNVECDKCTLQIIQVMDDLDIHRMPFPADDIYYQCIDIVLSNSAPETPAGTPVTNNGMVCGEQTMPTAGTGGAAGSAGAAGSTMSTSGAAATAGAGGAGGAGGAAGAAMAAAGATGTAGAPASGAAGRASTAGSSSGAAGSTSSAAGAAPSSGSAGIGTSMMGQTLAGSGAPEVAPPTAATDEGGCSVAEVGARATRAGFLWLSALGIAAFAVRLRRRRS